LWARQGIWRLAAVPPSSHLFASSLFLPVRAQWIARITEFEWHHYFADVQDKGPFKSWHHRHEFRAEPRTGAAGTLVRDVIEHEVGFGFLGAFGNAIFVRRQMQGTFAQRQQVLLRLLS
jgi:ligand-binding SRPBCC domain-containing protein